jgi:membrane protease YdiL (CAAX protease family)
MLSEKPWRAEFVLQFCAAQFVCLCLGVGLLGLLHKLGVRGFASDESVGSIVVGTLSFQGATWPLIFFFLRWKKINPLTALGFHGPRLKHALLVAIGFILVVLPTVLLLQGLCATLVQKFGFHAEDEAAVKLFSDAKSRWTIIYLGIFAVVIAPVAAEFIFRGLLYPFIKRLGWPKLAWFGVSFLFALIHLNVPTFLPLFALALALTWLYEKTDNLLAPITAHALFNATNLVALLWQIQHPSA